MTKDITKTSRKDLGTSTISEKGLSKSLEFEIEVYEMKQCIKMGEAINQHRNGETVSFSETINKNKTYADRLAQAGHLKSSWYEVSPAYKSDQEIRNENLGYEVNHL